MVRAKAILPPPATGHLCGGNSRGKLVLRRACYCFTDVVKCGEDCCDARRDEGEKGKESI